MPFRFSGDSPPSGHSAQRLVGYQCVGKSHSTRTLSDALWSATDQKGNSRSPLIFPGMHLLGIADFFATLRGAGFGRLTPSAFSNNSCKSFFSAAVTVLVKFSGRSPTSRCTLA